MRLHIKPLFPIALLIFSLFAACTKEQDVTTVEIEVEDPQPGETVVVRGTVRDTAETAIENALLRFRSGNFDQEISTDENGSFEIELPAAQEKGLIIAAKAQYNRTIQFVDLTADEVRKDLYLLENTEVQEANLELNTNALFTLTGRLVDQFGTPLPDVFLIGESLHTGDDEVKFSGQTDEEGIFEFVEEQKDYQIHVIFSSKLELPCFDRLFGTYPHGDDTLLDLGDVELAISEPREIMPDVSISDCPETDFVNHIYIPDDINVFQDQLLPGQSLTVCDTSINGAWMYNGVMSEDKQSFDGQFQYVADFADSQDFSLCTPEGAFVETRTADGTMLSPDLVYNQALAAVTVEDGSDLITFGWQGSFGTSSGGGSYTYSFVGIFEKTDADGNILYQLDPTAPYFLNWVTGNAGVLTARVVFPDGSTELITVRFRLN